MVKYLVSWEPPETSLTVSNGSGDIFEPGQSSTSGGTGFGLTIVKRIVEAHGWTLSLTDGPDGGTRFEFSMS